MVFSSLLFLFLFLPAVLLIYFLVPKKLRNGVLLVFSLFFYAWGEPMYVFLMLFTIVLDFFLGLLVDRCRQRGKEQGARWTVIFAVASNLGLLAFFKYTDFFLGNINGILHTQLPLLRIALPIGISFYTFQILSYVIDVYRGDTRVQRSIVSFGAYVVLFPQLIAGPIVRYQTVAEELDSRRETLEDFSAGISRFMCGLGKKVLLANNVGLLWEEISGLGAANTPVLTAWIGIFAFAFQIYFDFSGYSDMAIGLGKLFGFDFMENFNYPYLSSSVSEFWRRWHISLSTWFKEYLYIPLGGNRRGLKRTCFNLFIVFAATGLWHGASVTFVLWGMYYAVFLIAERLFLGKWLKNNPRKWMNHLYTLLVVFFGWMLFRAEHLHPAKAWLCNMLTLKKGLYPILMYADGRLFFWMAVGILLCGPLQQAIPSLKKRLYRQESTDIWDVVIMAGIVFYSTILLVSNTYNPFIYFRF